MQKADYKAQLASKDRYIEQLKEALITARNARFAASSEALHTYAIGVVQ